jgi:hypothetical protein
LKKKKKKSEEEKPLPEILKEYALQFPGVYQVIK